MAMPTKTDWTPSASNSWSSRRIEQAQWENDGWETVEVFANTLAFPTMLAKDEEWNSQERKDGAYPFREMPSFFILASSVVRLTPSVFAAPFSPLTRQPVSFSAWRMCSRSRSSSEAIVPTEEVETGLAN